MIYSWFPKLIIQYIKLTKLTMTSNLSRHINIYFNDEINRIGGWDLFTTRRKYEKKAIRFEGNRVNNTQDILNIL